MRAVFLALATLLALLRPSSAEETVITILTGSPSGVYYPLGGALSSIYAKAIPGARVTVQATAGSVENLKLLEAGDGEIGFTLGDTLTDAWTGNSDGGFTAPLRKLRGIAAIYRNFIQIVARAGSGITAITDLKGKRVSVGARGSGTALNAAAILKAAGLTFDELGAVDYSPFGTSVRLIEKGELDVTLQSAGLGAESIRHLLASTQSTLVPLPPDVIAKIGNPVYVPAIIPAGTYNGQSADVPTASVINFLVTREGVSDDVAYGMTKSLFEKLDQLVQTHPAAQEISLKNALSGMPIPLHPGAERYYREIGMLK
ncbi:MAG: TAXI family TRAP transporter solute-binding subunit [Alphaproteobacteria bacterium]